MNRTLKQVVSLAASVGLAASLVLPVATMAAGGISSKDVGLDAIQKSDLKLGSRDVRETAGSIINVALGFLGIVALAIVLLGGFKYMISGGNEEKTSEAKNLIISGVIGLAIILSAWAITRFVVANLLDATRA